MDSRDINMLASLVCGSTSKAAVSRMEHAIAGFGSIENLFSSGNDLGFGLSEKEKNNLLNLKEIISRVNSDKFIREMHTPSDVYRHAAKYINERQEHLIIYGIDTRNRVVIEHVVAVGWEAGINIHPRQILTFLVQRSIGRFIIVHNHPSGQCEPSYEDINFTNNIIGGAKLLGIDLLDHIVVARSGYHSMRQYNEANF